MPKGTTLVLIIWNVVLTALLGWSLMRKPATGSATSTLTDTTAAAVMPTPVVRDTGLLKDARIAYYELDSVELGYKLIVESKSKVESEKNRLRNQLKTAQDRAEARLGELSQKDPTFMTMAEQKAADEELRKLDADLRQMQMDAEKTIADLEVTITEKINSEIIATLEEYNKTAGFDFLISVQEAGQVWPGNKGLDVTKDIVQMLNARHTAAKKP